MRFVAKLVGVDKQERPNVIYSNYRQSCVDWADFLLAKHPTGRVEIYECIEQHVATVHGDGSTKRSKRLVVERMPWDKDYATVKPEDLGRKQ